MTALADLIVVVGGTNAELSGTTCISENFTNVRSVEAKTSNCQEKTTCLAISLTVIGLGC